MLHLESAVHGPRVRLNGVVKSFVASRVVAAFNDPGKRGALEGVWCLDYVLGEGGETGGGGGAPGGGGGGGEDL